MNFKEFQLLNMKYYLMTGGLCFSNSLYNNTQYSSPRIEYSGKVLLEFLFRYIVKLKKNVPIFKGSQPYPMLHVSGQIDAGGGGSLMLRKTWLGICY